MAKIKKPVKSKNDTQAASVILGLCVVALIVFFFISKGKEAHQQVPLIVHKHPIATSNPVEAGDAYLPNENLKTVEETHEEPMAPEPISKIPGTGGRIALIIDDWGQTTANCKYLQEIPEPMAVSILPGLRHTKDVANCAALNHKLAMLHLPLEAMHNFDFYPPNYIIKTTMESALVVQIVEKDLNQLPSIEGVNNHMGSKATADRALMRIIFDRIKRRGLFFVDSMTSHYSVSAALAREMGLAYAKRDVFLDNINTREAITKQMMLLAKEARHRGYAIAIGHDRHLTMQVIKDEIPLLEAQGFQFVSIKDLLKKK